MVGVQPQTLGQVVQITHRAKILAVTYDGRPTITNHAKEKTLTSAAVRFTDTDNTINGTVGIARTTDDLVLGAVNLDAVLRSVYGRVILSAAKGVQLPAMTKTQRDAISSPTAGTMVYQTDNTPGLRVFNGTNWMRFTETAD